MLDDSLAPQCMCTGSLSPVCWHTWEQDPSWLWNNNITHCWCTSQQFTLLSTISNYHWADLSIDNVWKIIKGGSSRYVSHFMSWHGTEENCKYLTGSPCNRILHFIIEDYSSLLHNLVKYLYNKDNGLEDENPEIPQLDDQPDSQSPLEKRKRYHLTQCLQLQVPY